MPKSGIDRVARSLLDVGTRREALLVICAMLIGPRGPASLAAERRTGSSILDKRRKRAERRGRRKKNRGADGRSGGIARGCQRFVISAGPNPNDRFQHIDDDLLIELIPRRSRKGVQVILDDDNDSPNGQGGSHPKPPPFKARVGDQIHIVARNEVAGGCELDEIWLHCTEAGGGKMKLTDAVTPADCQPEANQVGVFFETTIRIE